MHCNDNAKLLRKLNQLTSKGDGPNSFPLDRKACLVCKPSRSRLHLEVANCAKVSKLARSPWDPKNGK
jgi:hypothetical protein